MKRISYSLFSAIFLLFMFLFVSCREEVLPDDSSIPEEGLPAKINLRVNIGDMGIGTRFAGFSPEDDNTRKISRLWVGIYNVNSGALVTSDFFEENSLKESHEKNGEIELSEMSTVSGQYYVVAVANANRHNGVIIGEDGSEGEKRNLEDLLTYNARTWNDFKKISILLSNPTSVSKIGDGFPMSGCYTEDKNPHKSLLSDNGNPPVVTINPGNNNFSGSIHLQRIDSYIKFIVKPDDNITITPISWQVKNIPGASFVMERAGSCESSLSQELINASDAVKKGMFWQDNNLNITSQYFYHDSEIFPSGYFVKGEETGSYTFDFCVMENKHKGIIKNDNKKYSEREREYKNNDDTNTGWYCSLVPEVPDNAIKPTNASPLFRNNNATFLELKVQVEYYHSYDDKFTPVAYDPANGNIVKRVADAVYTIHLGNVKYGNEAADVNDFNCYRNTNTTYSVTISGADNIRVEATDQNEIASGAEGTVTDIEESFMNLDCHYGVFNIQMTDQQRRDLTWRIRAPYGEKYIDMASGPDLAGFSSPVIINLTDNKNKTFLESLPDNQFYNWIQIVPTEEDVIAKYPGDPRLINRSDLGDYPTSNIPSLSDYNSYKGVWYLEDFRDVDNFNHWYSKDEGENILRWYTVFIDEYVYEFDYSEQDNSMTGNDPISDNWKNFVNKDYRKLWIRLGRPDISNDGESMYSKSLYLITQESIQTYYNEMAEKCLGIEHINESYTGERYDERFTSIWDVDGRNNSWFYVTNDVKKNWDNIYSQSGLLKTGCNYNGESVTYYLPDHDHHFMKGTLSRNRDLNGNGTIEDFELRWFLPSVSTYMRITIGSVSLKTPLFNFLDYTETDIMAGTGNAFSHFIASDNNQLWAEELAATGSITDTNMGGNIRCVRYMGEPMTIKPGQNNIVKAYEYDETTHTVNLTYYRSVALRPSTDGVIDTNFVGDLSSYPSRKFKVAKDDCKDEEGNPIISSYGVENWSNSIHDNDVCGNYKEDGDNQDAAVWRIPNISELAILFFIDQESPNKILTQGRDIRYISCSREYFEGESKRFMGIQVGNNISANFHKGANLYIRCVKDIIE